MKDILEKENIPFTNLILKSIYEISLAYKANHNSIPNNYEIYNFVHNDTRNCLFDMDGNKTDIIYSCIKPTICEQCEHNLSNINNKLLSKVKKEIKRLNKSVLSRNL